MKNYTNIKEVLIWGGAVFAFAAAAAANAQLFYYTGTSTVPSSSIISPATTTTVMVVTTTLPTPVVSSTPVPVVTTPIPLPSTPPPPSVTGLVQFDNLVVQGISSEMVPAEIVAMNPSAVIASTTSMNASSGMITAPASGPILMPTTCEEFLPGATIGTPVTCPTPANSSSSFFIAVSPTTSLLLNDRTQAALGNITPGDMINVYGIYDGSENIEADVLRDISKPSMGIASSTSIGETSPAGAENSSITTIETDISELQTVIQQLIQEINLLVASSSASGPMIPYVPGGTQSTTLMTPTSSTGTIY